MRQFHHAVLERHYPYTESFATEPYETGWASEGLFFVRVDQMSGDDATLTPRVQLSPDGVNWVDEGTALDPIREPGLHWLRVKHFGGWLRLWCDLAGDQPRVEVTIQLDLKE